MAEITSGTELTVLVLNETEAHHLQIMLQDWVDDSFARALTSGMSDIETGYRETVAVLRDLFESFGVNPDIEEV